MALKKDEIAVWLSRTQTDSGIFLSLIACPRSRLKETETRLQTASLKKVKGNRLDQLEYSFMEEASQPFVEEFLGSLLRISDLSGWAGLFYRRTPQLESALWRQAARFLKERFKDASFTVYFDPARIRSSVLHNWKGKNHLPALFEPLEEGSLFLKSAALIGRALMEPPQNTAAQAVHSKARRLVKMTPSWEWIDPLEMYLQLFSLEQEAQLRQVLERMPRLMEQGTLEKWMRKELPSDFFSSLLLLADEQTELNLTELSPARIHTQALRLLEARKQAQKPFPAELFEDWCARLENHLDSIESLKGTGVQSALKERIRTLLDGWIEAPHQPSCLRPVIWIKEDFEEFRILISPLLPWLEQVPEASILPEAARLFTWPRKDPEGLAVFLAGQKPLGRVLTTSKTAGTLRSLSVRTNQFFPLYCIEDSRKDALEALGRKLAVSSFPARKLHTPTPWFPASVYQSLSQDQLLFLAAQPLSVQETRLLARAFSKGLTLEKAWECLIRSKGSVFSLVRSYLYPTRIQGLLRRLPDAKERVLLSRPGLTFSQIRALHEMVLEGIPCDWLEVNLKANATLRSIQSLRTRFPWGVVPYSWKFLDPMPPKLFEWVIHAAAARHPNLEKKELALRLAAWNTALTDLLFASGPPVPAQGK